MKTRTLRRARELAEDRVRHAKIAVWIAVTGLILSITGFILLMIGS